MESCLNSTQKAWVRILGTQWCSLWVISLYMCENVQYNIPFLHSFSFSFFFILFPFLYVVSNLFLSPCHFPSSLTFTHTISLLHLHFLIHHSGYPHNHFFLFSFFFYVVNTHFPSPQYFSSPLTHTVSLFISILIPSLFTFSSIPFSPPLFFY